MATPAKDPQRRSPPPSPLHLLYGLEKSVPQNLYSPGQASLTPFGTPTLSASPLTSLLNESLPEHPESPLFQSSRASSVYSRDSAKSGDSGYTKIVQSYGERDDGEPPPMPVILEPKAYRDTVAPLLAKCFSLAPTPDPIPTQSHMRKQSIPFLRLSPDISPPPSVDSRYAPSFTEFSRNIKERRNDLVSLMSCQLSADLNRVSSGQMSSPDPSPIFSSMSFEDQQAQGFMLSSGRATDDLESELIPSPLNLSISIKAFSIGDTPHSHSQFEELGHPHQPHEVNLTPPIASRTNVPPLSPRPRESAPATRPEQIERVNRLSTDSFSSDSFTVYNGARETVRAMIKHKMQKVSTQGKKRESKNLRCVMSFVERQSPTKKTSSSFKVLQKRSGDSQRSFSWVSSRRSSLQTSISNLIRKVSVRDRRDREEERWRPMERGRSRRRQKQCAISSTPYQRYGSDIWLAKNKRKRAARRAAAAAAATKSQVRNRDIGFGETKTNLRTKLEREPMRFEGKSPIAFKWKTSEFAAALQNGSSRLLHIFSGMGIKGTSASQRRRDGIKKSIMRSGPTIVSAMNVDRFEDGGWV